MRIRDRVVDIVSRLPARVQTKLLVAFLAMATLLMLMGAVGLQDTRAAAVAVIAMEVVHLGLRALVQARGRL